MAQTIEVSIHVHNPEKFEHGYFRDERGMPVVKAKDWSPGLAVCRFDGEWQVTHRASGYKVAVARTRKHGVEMMAKLDTLTDWTLDAETIGADKSVVEKVRAIEAEDAPAKVSRPVLPSRAAVEALAQKGPWKGSSIFARYVGGTPRWLILHPSGGWMALFMDEQAEQEAKDLLDAERKRLADECVAEAKANAA